MKTTSPREYLKQFSKVSIDVLKELAAKGQELSVDTLVAALETNDDITNILNNLHESAPQSQKSKAPSPETEKLKAQLKAQQSQKSQLVKQIDEIEDSRNHENSFYLRTILMFCRLVHDQGDQSFTQVLAEFQDLLKKAPSISSLEDGLQKLKDAALKRELDIPAKDTHKEKKETFLSRIFKGPPEPSPSEKSVSQAHIEQIKMAYREILNELRLNMGNEQLDSITEISQRITRSTTLEHLHLVRDKILHLLQNFINTIYTERVLAAGFINEISQRLVAVESHILRSLDQTGKFLTANREYNLKLGEHLGALRNSVEYSKTLADLKNAVVSKLDVIGEVIEAKSKEDGLQENDSEERLQLLQQDLNEMKNKVSSAEEHAKTLEKELLIDPLTGAFNRRAYDRRVEEEMERFLRYQNIFSLLLFDVDHFKKINDTYGHAVGDKCLKEIIARIKPAIRKVDFLARYGGEEFIVILPETESAMAGKVAEKLRRIVENIEFLHKGEVVQITISVGVTQIATPDKSLETVFTRMDQAMYTAKNAGRNQVITK